MRMCIYIYTCTYIYIYIYNVYMFMYTYVYIYLFTRLLIHVLHTNIYIAIVLRIWDSYFEAYSGMCREPHRGSFVNHNHARYSRTLPKHEQLRASHKKPTVGGAQVGVDSVAV